MEIAVDLERKVMLFSISRIPLIFKSSAAIAKPHSEPERSDTHQQKSRMNSMQRPIGSS
jgi:hypothetical protein